MTNAVQSPYEVAFSVTERGLYFIPPPESDRSSTIEFRDWNSGETRTITRIPEWAAVGLDVSPDGQYLLYSQIDRLDYDLRLVGTSDESGTQHESIIPDAASMV